MPQTHSTNRSPAHAFYQTCRNECIAAMGDARLVCVILIIAMALLFWGGAGVFALLSQTPEQIAKGEFWRLLTSHLVHFSLSHLLMNLAALALVAAAVLGNISRRALAIFFISNALALGILLNFLNPEYAPYAGFSGLLHGFLIFALIASPFYSRPIKALALLLITAKIAHEQLPGFTPSDLQASMGAAVAVDAHLYGALLGLASSAAYQLLPRSTRG